MARHSIGDEGSARYKKKKPARKVWAGFFKSN